MGARIRRRLRPRPFDHLDAPAVVKRVVAEASSLGARLCFLNNADAASLAPLLRRFAPDLRLVFLSHGVELTDVVNNLLVAPAGAPGAAPRPAWLGNLLLNEIAQRQALDAVLCISEFDQEFERWLGARAVLFLPRQIPAHPLPLKPVAGRVGCVATLDHGPNLHGLGLFAEVLARHSEVRLRLVGAPRHLGEDLARRHACVDYLGRLDDGALAAEASTWRAFVNPIFCSARGASTKVATALGWGLPVLTTPHGARGYRWPADALPLAESSHDLAALTVRVATDADSRPWFAAADAVRRAAPNLHESAGLLRAFLDKLAA